MASILQILAELEENEHTAIDFDRIRMRVGPSDRAAGQFLIEFLNEAEKRQVTYEIGELVLLLRLADAISNTPAEEDPEEVVRDSGVRAALDNLFWFNLHEQMVNTPQPPPLDIRSVWVRRPQPHRLRQTYQEQTGIVVDACLQKDYQTVQWAIRAGDSWILDKKGLWINEPRPSSRTDEFFERTRWDSFEAAYAFATKWVAEENAIFATALAFAKKCIAKKEAPDVAL